VFVGHGKRRIPSVETGITGVTELEITRACSQGDEIVVGSYIGRCRTLKPDVELIGLINSAPRNRKNSRANLGEAARRSSMPVEQHRETRIAKDFRHALESGSTEELSKVYEMGVGQLHSLARVDVEIFARARYVAIMGPSGSGKSTLII